MIHIRNVLLLKVFSWGYNSNGELGIGNTSNQPTPSKVSLNGVVTKVNIQQLAAYTCQEGEQMGIFPFLKINGFAPSH